MQEISDPHGQVQQRMNIYVKNFTNRISLSNNSCHLDYPALNQEHKTLEQSE